MKNLTKIMVFLSLGISINLFYTVSSIAQTASQNQPNNTGYQNNEENSSSTLGGSLKPFDLIHNMNLNRGSFDVEASNQNINQESDNFKIIQQQRLLEMLEQNQNLTEINNIETTETININQ